MIRSFRCRDTQRVYLDEPTRTFPNDILRRARETLASIDAAVSLNDLRTPPSNRLEALSGDRKGQHSIRINLQWRVCFVWEGGDAYDVEITDYH
jgi:proteic killer suppression protein